MLDRRAEELDLTRDEYVVGAEREISSWVRDAELRIRLTEDGLLGFLRDRHYRTFLDIGTSNGSTSRQHRLDVEQALYDLSDSADAAFRPISAYLAGSDESGPIRRYGNIVLRLSPGTRQHALFMLGDTMECLGLGGVFEACVIPEPLMAPTVWTAHMRVNVLKHIRMADACHGHLRYAEAALFYDLTPTDVVEVVLTDGVGLSPQTMALVCGAHLACRPTRDATS